MVCVCVCVFANSKLLLCESRQVCVWDLANRVMKKKKIPKEGVHMGLLKI